MEEMNVLILQKGQDASSRIMAELDRSKLERQGFKGTDGETLSTWLCFNADSASAMAEFCSNPVLTDLVEVPVLLLGTKAIYGIDAIVTRLKILGFGK